MARRAISLTETQIEEAKPRAKEYILVDGDGLRLKVMPSGYKSWLFNYVSPSHRRRTNISLGRYPETSLEQARVKASECKDLLAKEIDPKAEKDKATQNLLTVAKQMV